MSRQWDEAVDDVSKVPSGAASVRLMAGARHFDRLPNLDRLTSLWCFDVDERALDVIGRCASLQSLYVENIKAANLTAFGRLPALKILGLERCSKAASLIDLAGLTRLQALGITHFKNVHDLQPLAALEGLRSLGVAGSMWTAMRVESFRPLAGLRALEFLHLTNIKAADGSLQPLAQLTNLKTLDIANFYPVSEFAALARRLPSTECTWFKPFIEVKSITCKKCGSAMVMLSGKRSMLCRQCDAPRLEKHVAAWRSA